MDGDGITSNKHPEKSGKQSLDVPGYILRIGLKYLSKDIHTHHTTRKTLTGIKNTHSDQFV